MAQIPAYADVVDEYLGFRSHTHRMRVWQETSDLSAISLSAFHAFRMHADQVEQQFPL